jgi:N-acetylglucosaminyldiphosphoundecaprenol N-acetyl-beta-D-mannosaminyltransferase
MVDGQLMVKLLKALGIANVNRKSFDFGSIAVDVFLEAEKTRMPIYFLGTTNKNLELAITNIKNKYPLLNLVGSHHGYFDSNYDKKDVIHKILELKPKIIVVGTGTPNQEDFLIELRLAGYDGTGFTCGGFFHQTANKVDYYPKFINKYHLRWIYRIYDEPKLAKRYFLAYPVAILMLIWDVAVINK